MNFGQALEALKQGSRIARQGWNGKRMYVYLNKGSVDVSPYPEEVGMIEGIHANLFETGDRGTITRLPNINMWTATSSIVTGWLASQTDMLAEDWQVL